MGKSKVDTAIAGNMKAKVVIPHTHTRQDNVVCEVATGKREEFKSINLAKKHCRKLMENGNVIKVLPTKKKYMPIIIEGVI